MNYKFDHADLCEKVGLERTYEFTVTADLPSGTAGYAFDDGRIEIAAGLSEKRAKQVYLHEIGHLLARSALVHNAPRSDGHNKYFATLVAVMYRRAGGDLLNGLKVYDFADAEEHVRYNGQGPLPTEEELVSRFAFIMYRSAILAKKPWSVEQIGKHLFKRMLDEEAGRPIAPELDEKPLWYWISSFFRIGAQT